jgi:hypothetical protein
MNELGGVALRGALFFCLLELLRRLLMRIGLTVGPWLLPPGCRSSQILFSCLDSDMLAASFLFDRVYRSESRRELERWRRTAKR